VQAGERNLIPWHVGRRHALWYAFRCAGIGISVNRRLLAAPSDAAPALWITHCPGFLICYAVPRFSYA